MPWALRGLRNGVLTTRWPDRPDEYADQFFSAVAVRPHADTHLAGSANHHLAQVTRACPTGAISIDSGRVRLDQGKCILCGRCVTGAPESFRWSGGSATAVLVLQG